MADEPDVSFQSCVSSIVRSSKHSLFSSLQTFRAFSLLVILCSFHGSSCSAAVVASKDFSSSSSFYLSSSSEELPGWEDGTRQLFRRESGIDSSEPKLIALKLKNVNKDASYDDNGGVIVLEGTPFTIIFYGYGISNNSEVKLTTFEGSYGDSCISHDKTFQTRSFPLLLIDESSASIELPEGLDNPPDSKKFYVCLKASEDDVFVHQGSGSDSLLHIGVYSLLLPIWIMVLILICLLSLSGLFSGLNLGLMALDQTELKIVQNTGSDEEKDYANKIAPVRAHGNFLLCSLLLGNVLVNNSLTILLDTLTSGIVAVLGATMGIVIFGEIIPQALCSRHGLAVGAHTIWLTKFFMVLTFPLSYPISKILDKILGTEIGTVYNKERLMELLRVTNEYNDLENDEVNIVTGALVYKRKTVRDVMTKLEDCYFLPLNTVVNFETLSEIRQQGYSRIPVYDGDRTNIVNILFAKDLMFVDPDDNMPLSAICSYYNYDVNFVFHDTPLNVMFNEFKSGDKGHMAFVQDINTEGEGDPFYETCGLVTLEDIIEEIIQQEIVDETDIVTDNKTKKRLTRGSVWKAKEENISMAIGQLKDAQQIQISPQLTMAVFQYLSTCVEPFKPVLICEPVLKKLLVLDIFKEIKVKQSDQKSDTEIISRGKPIDFFILIIEGRVEVNIGKEGLIFEGGPFTYFGVQTLVSQTDDASTMPSSPNLIKGTPGSNSQSELAATPTMRSSLRKANSTHNSSIDSKRNSATDTHNHRTHFIPDYSVKPVTDILFLKIKRTVYAGAVKASNLMSHHQTTSGEFAEKELDRLLEKVSEDEISDLARTPEVYSPDKSFSSSFRRDSIRNSLNTALKKTFSIGNQKLAESANPTPPPVMNNSSAPSLPDTSNSPPGGEPKSNSAYVGEAKDDSSSREQNTGSPTKTDVTTTLLSQENTSLQ
ncbi:unextended protein [Lepeophtheirus salmonis]|nr:metal transporter CNNM4-like isoform X1 [Lepeophtheirus salmonis]